MLKQKFSLRRPKQVGSLRWRCFKIFPMALTLARLKAGTHKALSCFHKDAGAGYAAARARCRMARKPAEAVFKERDFHLKESQRLAAIGSYTLDIHSGFWKSSD